MRYAIVIEKSPANFAAYVPDLPGCVATGATLDEEETLIREAIAFPSRRTTGGWPTPPTSKLPGRKRGGFSLTPLTTVPLSYRGFDPGRRGPFLSGKGPKTIDAPPSLIEEEGR
nr:type II toxin-antitoxin system HicB family antitoxin [Candidatus Nitrospira neomarina]